MSLGIITDPAGASAEHDGQRDLCVYLLCFLECRSKDGKEIKLPEALWTEDRRGYDSNKILKSRKQMARQFVQMEKVEA